MNDNYNNQNGFNNQNNMGMNGSMPGQPMYNNSNMMNQGMNSQQPMYNNQNMMNQGMGQMQTQQSMMNNYQPQMSQGEKKSNKMLFIILGVVIGAIVIGLGVYFGAKAIEKKRAKDVLDQYENQLKLEEEETAKLQNNYTATVHIMADEDFIVEFKNNNSVAVDASLKVEFYDENNQLVNSEDAFITHLSAGKTAYEKVFLLSDEKKYATYKITAKLSKVMYSKLYDDKLSFTTNKTDSNLLIQATNNSTETIKTVDLVVLFYNAEGKIIGFDDTYLNNVSPNETTSAKVSLPKDKNYDDLEYAKAEVVVNSAYTEEF